MRRDVEAAAALILMTFMLSPVGAQAPGAAEAAVAARPAAGVAGTTPRAATPDQSRITSIAFLRDDIVCGTPSGLIHAAPGETFRVIPGAAAFVTAAVSDGLRIVAATDKGLYEYGGRRSSATPLPSAASDPFVSAVALRSGAVYSGGAGGLHEISAAGARRIEAPESNREILALHADARGLLVALPRKLYRFLPPDSWTLLMDGATYKALLSSKRGFWLGLRSDGTVDICTEKQFAMPVKLELPFAGDVVTAIAISADSEVLLLGTLRGRVLSATGADGLVNVRWQEVHSSRFGSHPVRAIASPDGKQIYCGTDGGGVMLISPGAEEPVWLMHGGATNADTPSAASRGTDERSSPRNELVDKIGAYVRARIHFIAAAFLLAAMFIAAIIAIVGRLRGGSSKSKLRERRRSSRSGPTMPSIETLSKDLAEFAVKLKHITERTNELTRRAPFENSPELEVELRGAAAEFEEVDAWLRARAVRLREERVTKVDRLGELKRLMKNPNETNRREIEDELREIESWLKQVEIDEAYLKYVLEM